MNQRDNEGSNALGVEVRRFLRQHRAGVLSTHSTRFEGYPFGSVIPFVLDLEARPAFLISSLAEHYRNMFANPKVSLLVQDASVSDVQVAPRLTLVGDAAPMATEVLEHIRPRYLRYFPDSSQLLEFGDFSFWCLTPVSIRYVGGFGKIHWVSTSEFLPQGHMPEQIEETLMSEMSSEQCLRLSMCSVPCLDTHTPDARLLGVDCDGLDLLTDTGQHRINFSRSIYSMDDIRREIGRLTGEQYEK
jgi:putative heme iron utilization protein